MTSLMPKSNYSDTADKQFGREELPAHFCEIKQLIDLYVPKEKSVVILELGCGKGAMKDIHPDYIGLDISQYVLDKYLKGKRAICADIQNLPFGDNSVDFIFSISAIEHVSRPDKVFLEINSVLKEKSVAYIAPSWFCRDWTATGLHLKKYSELSFTNKVRKMLIPLRHQVIWRSFFVIPRRVLREIFYFVPNKLLNLKCKKLSPNLNEYVCSDCDAFVSMDPHAVILFYLSRNYRILGPCNIFHRIFYKHRPVVVMKKKEI